MNSQASSFSRRRNKAFTLLELLIVMAIIAVLAGLTLMVSRNAMIASKKRKSQAVLMGIETGLDKYFTEYGEYPVPVSPAPGIDKDSSSSAWNSAKTLYQALSGDGSDKINGVTPSTASNGTVESDEKFIMELQKDWYDWRGANYGLKDGFGNPWQYRRYDTAEEREANQMNVSTYDLWSYGETKGDEGGGALDEPKNATAEGMAKWITNWR
jgi:prepilin-type N-terminal cleavage/methylation domain-containing protein